jgi:hypothetical protein
MLFQTVRLMVRHQFAAWIALFFFITNPNVLYLQTTALTEPVLLMALTASTYYLVRWSLQDSVADLAKAALFAAVAVGTRYDGWFFALASGVIILLTTLLRTRDVDRAEGTTLAYLALPLFAMLLWLFYNWLIFGDPLEFERGRFSAAFQQGQIAAQGMLPTKLHLLVSLKTYSGDVLLNLGSLVTALGVTGLVIYAASNRMRPESLAAYSFVAAYVFNVIALYLGQTTITTPLSRPPGYFNTRYGLVALPAAAFFIGYLADFLARRYKPVLSATVLCALLLLQGALWAPDWPLRVVTIADGLQHEPETHAAIPAAVWLGHHYDGGSILYDEADFGGKIRVPAMIVQASGLDMRDFYLVGPLQNMVLKDPARFVRWIVFAPLNPNDRVNATLGGTSYLKKYYAPQFKGGGYVIYRRTGPALH